MIHIFRIFSTNDYDFLEFVSKEDVVKAFRRIRIKSRFDWQVYDIEKALQEEKRPTYKMNLNAMKQRGDVSVVRTLVEGRINWFSPSATTGQGIPSEYQVALKFFVSGCQHYRITEKHHEVFKVMQEKRFYHLTEQVIASFLERVKQTKCATRLDKYMDLNLRKLKNYGVFLKEIEGSYIQIREMLRQHEISCPFFSDYFMKLVEVSIHKEQELVGENRHYVKKLA